MVGVGVRHGFERLGGVWVVKAFTMAMVGKVLFVYQRKSGVRPGLDVGN
jgi:hypothetical protein